jgi:hypothetical protein
MKTLGTFTAVLLSGVAAFALAVGVRSIPDVRRYLKMRNM